MDYEDWKAETKNGVLTITAKITKKNDIVKIKIM